MPHNELDAQSNPDFVPVRIIPNDPIVFEVFFEEDGPDLWRPEWAKHTIPSGLAERYKRVRDEWFAIQEDIENERRTR